MARPPREIDYSIIEGLARIQCTNEEIAATIGFSVSGFHKRRKNDPELVEALEKGREVGKMSLRRLQWDAAKGGNNTMLVWLGKQYLGQSDKQEVKQSGEICMFGKNAPVEDV